MAKKLIKSIQEVAYHRNGICGTGFYAIRFTSDIEAEDTRFTDDPNQAVKGANFLGIVFDDPGKCAVVCLDLIPERGVKFAGGNSWRGDRYEPELREAIKTNQTSGGIRVGPFCLPTA